MTEDLIAFIKARIDEDEAVAGAAGGFRWEADEEALKADHGPHGVEQIGELWTFPDNPAAGYISDTHSAAHIARHDPARVLREVEAKRRILSEVVAQIDEMDEKIEGEWGSGPYLTGESDLLLALLALPYRDHPDYRAEWIPRALIRQRHRQ